MRDGAVATNRGLIFSTKIKVSVYMPSISIAVSSYNQLEFLKQALDSVTTQTVPYDEIIVTDDASTDDSPAFLAEWEKQGPNRRVIFLKTNQGRGSVRNIAIKEMQGDYLAFLDGDDWLEPRAAENVRKVLDQSAPDLVAARTNFFDHDTNSFVKRGHVNPFYSMDVFSKGTLTTPSERAGLFRILPAHWQKVHRAEFMRENGIGCHFETYEDIPWHHQAVVRAREVVCIDAPIVNYRQHQHSILKTPWEGHFVLFDVVDDCDRFMTQDDRSDPVLHRASRLFLFNLMAFSLLHSPRVPEDLKPAFANKILEREHMFDFEMNEWEAGMLAGVRDIASGANGQ